MQMQSHDSDVTHEVCDGSFTTPTRAHPLTPRRRSDLIPPCRLSSLTCEYSVRTGWLYVRAEERVWS
jgi:hypothetical protein